MPARIVDDQGFVAVHSDPAPAQTLQFHPSSDYFFRPPAIARNSITQSTEDDVYQGRSYYLEIYPSPEVEAGTEYEITISVGTEARPKTDHNVYLPLIVR